MQGRWFWVWCPKCKNYRIRYRNARVCMFCRTKTTRCREANETERHADYNAEMARLRSIPD